MIISRSPLRISLGGGGTDLPSYYRDHGGFLVAGAINRYVYVNLVETFTREMLIRYSQHEVVKHPRDIRHPIIRHALLQHGVEGPNLEITTIADIPAGTGLGSSGSFTTALLKAIYKHKMAFVSPRDLAEEACHIEIDLLSEPVGKQDQYIAAFGGLTVFEFHPDGRVDARPLRVPLDRVRDMEDHFLLFSTGQTRAASDILREQDNKSKAQDPSMVDNLHYIKELGHRSAEALEAGDLERFGLLMHDHWEHKKRRSARMSNPDIDRWYDLGRQHGAVGGKLIGAGGGGFLMFYTEQPARLRRAMRAEGLGELRFNFDFEGTKILS
ncbi:MAG: galactokinase [Deltaproteobacteria bacterium]|nr:galactokinase [Deltaproteobacteria bacterium]